MSHDSRIRPFVELLSKDPWTVNMPKIRQSPNSNSVVRNLLPLRRTKCDWAFLDMAGARRITIHIMADELLSNVRPVVRTL